MDKTKLRAVIQKTLEETTRKNGLGYLLDLQEKHFDQFTEILVARIEMEIEAVDG